MRLTTHEWFSAAEWLTDCGGLPPFQVTARDNRVFMVGTIALADGSWRVTLDREAHSSGPLTLPVSLTAVDAQGTRTTFRIVQHGEESSRMEVDADGQAVS